jgi:hypothetical protein
VPSVVHAISTVFPSVRSTSEHAAGVTRRGTQPPLISAAATGVEHAAAAGVAEPEDDPPDEEPPLLDDAAAFSPAAPPPPLGAVVVTVHAERPMQNRNAAAAIFDILGNLQLFGVRET